MTVYTLTASINLETNDGPVIQIQHSSQVSNPQVLNISEWIIRGESNTRLQPRTNINN